MSPGRWLITVVRPAAVLVVAGLTAVGLLAPAISQASHGGGDLVVAINDPACDDAVGDPFCTIRAAVDTAEGGEHITVAPGVYGPFTVTADVTIIGQHPNRTIVSGFGEGRVVTVEAGLTEVVISRMTLSHGLSDESNGGGLLIASPTTLQRVIVSANESASNGGGIAVQAELTILDSTISGNAAGGDGGGIWAAEGAGEITIVSSTIAGNAASRGGGVAAAGNSMAIIDSTVSGNTSELSGGGIHVSGGTTMTIDGSTIDSNESTDSDGGGIAMETADLTAANSTISGNRAPSDGGGIFTGQSAPVLRNVTITANSAGLGGGIATDSLLATSAKNTIIAGNTASFGGPDCTGSGTDVESIGYTLIGDTTECDVSPGPGDISDVDAGLGPLAGNGGPTATHALLAGSPAIEAGSPATPGGDDPTACEDVDQRDVPRPQQELCDIGALETSGATLLVELASDTVETPPGATRVPVADIALDALGSQASAPISSVPISSVPISSVPISSVPISSVPISSVPISSVPISSVPISSVPISSVNVPCGDATGWEQVLAGTPLEGVPIQTVTLQDVLALDAASTNDCVAELVVGNADFSQSVLGKLSLAALSFGDRPLDEIPLNGGAGAAGDEWCAFLAAAGFDCATNDITGSSTIAALDIADAPISSVPISSVPISSVPISSVPISSVPISSVPISSVNAIFDCETFDCATFATFGDAFAAGALRPEATFGDYFFGLLEGSDFPWEELPLEDIGVQRFDPNAPVVDYRVEFSVFGTELVLPGTVDMTLPEGFLYVEGSGSLTVDGGGASATFAVDDPAVMGTTHSFDLPQAIEPLADHTLSFLAYPGLRLGVFSAAATVTVGAAMAAASGTAPVTVIEAFEPEGNSVDTAPVVESDVLLISHVATEGDTDFYSVPIPDLAGARIQLSLSQLDADNDLIIYRPVADQLSAYPESDTGTQIAPVEDPGINSINQQNALAPETIQDIGIQSLPISSVSANRDTTDEQVDTKITSDEAASEGVYTIQVSGYNGATSADPYVLRARVTDPVGYPVCDPHVLPFDPGPPIATFDPAATPDALNTVFLLNMRRLEGRYGTAEAQQVLADLQGLVDLLNDDSSTPADPELAALGLTATIVPVEAVIGTDMSTHYEAWDQNPCNPDTANDVVGGITEILEAIDDNGTSDLQFITVVGSDEMIPYARVPDLTTLSNQADYAGVFPTQTALYGASVSEHVLSDDAYGDVDPIPWLGRQLFVPDRAVGRLVENPAEIRTAIELFIVNDGALDPATSLVTGYDFLTDGALEVDGALDTNLPQPPVTLINDTWTAADVGSLLLPSSAPAPEVGALNAHFDHYRLQPAAGGDELYTVEDILLNGTDDNGDSRLESRIFFSMGCNAAINVPDDYFDASDLRISDWAQVFSRHGAIMVGNTGFGYGDTAAVALSERLMGLFAERLDGSMTAAQALTFAKQEYVAGLGLYGVFDEKALVEATFYGMPFYGLSGSGAVPPAPDPLTTVPDPATGLTTATVAVSIDPENGFGEVPTETGSFLEVSGFDLTDVAGGGQPQSQPGNDAQVTHYRPIQPRVELDVTGDGTTGRAHGALLTELASVDIEDFDAAVARPVIDLSENEPELLFAGTIFPSALQNINSFKTPVGDRQRLVLMAGQFFLADPETGLGVQRTYTDFETQIFYSESDDFDPPFIAMSSAQLIGGFIDFDILVEENPDDLPAGNDTVTRVVALWKDNPTTWQRVELVDQGDGHWTGSGGPVVGLDTEYLIQAVDASGNVGVSTNKGRFHEADLVAATLEAPEVDEGSEAAITVQFSAPDAALTATIDWGDGTQDIVTNPSSPFEASHTYANDGVFTIEICISDGAGFEMCDQLEITVRNVPPLVDAGPDQSLPDTSVAVIVSATFSDPGNDDHVALIDWGDSTTSEGLITGDLVSGSHFYAAEGTYTVTVEVFDDDGSGTDSFEVRIGNEGPEVAEPAPDVIAPEGTSVENGGSFLDPDGDAIVSIAADIGDTVDLGEGAWSWSYTPPDGPAEVIVTVTATDDQGNTGTDQFVVTVTDVAPVAVLEGAAVTPEGSVYSLGVDVADPGDDTVTAVLVDWGDGSVDVGPPGTFEHVYLDGPDEVTIGVDATNEDGTFEEAGTLEVSVSNVAPTAEITVDPPSPIDLGTAVSLTSAVTDPGDDTFSYAWEVTDSEGGIVAGGTTDSLLFTPLATGTFTATLIVTDSDGDSGEPAEAVFEVVGDDEPIIDGLDVTPAGPIPVGTEVTATASFTGTVATATVDWGDGTVDPVTPTSGILQAAHTYTEAGLYEVAVTVTGPGGTSDTETFSFVVVFDELVPTRGGGTIINPTDSTDPPNDSATAQFSFSTRYRRSGELGGTLRFALRGEELTFQSTDLTYAVVAGNRADIAGTGTLNDVPGYTMQIIAIDGDRSGGDDVDRFRARILLGEEVVYDSAPGTDPLAAPDTGLLTGGIRIGGRAML